MTKKTWLIVCALMSVVAGSACAATPAGKDQDASWCLRDSGVMGGLVVLVGCDNGEQAVALHANSRYLVHALDADAATVAKARALVAAKSLAGAVSVDRWGGATLPYVDNMVNLLIDATGTVDPKEAMRVIAPAGVLFTKRDGQWTKTIKPRPDTIDEWTHYLHGANNNAVAKDSVVGSPRHLQWEASPQHARSHEHFATVTAVVSANGRLFSILDGGPALAVALPAKWWLVARDAFNGLELWRQPIDSWHPHLSWFRSGPGQLGRRLVAVGDRVYVTLGYGKPVAVLDAATGMTLKTYANTENTSEMLLDNGVLYLVMSEPTGQETAGRGVSRWVAGTPVCNRVVALQADTGNERWSMREADARGILPTTLAVSGGLACFQNGQAVVCLDALTGVEKWRAPRATGERLAPQSPPTLVIHEDVVLSADPSAPPPPEDPDAVPLGYGNQASENAGELVALSATNGAVLWKARCYPNFMSPVDVLVADGVVWGGQLWSVVNPGITNARELRTGKIVRRRPPDNPDSIVVSHHRCHRFRATERFLVLSRAGIELLDIKTGKMEMNHWIRGTCQLGPLPCNGLIYAPPHSCACFAEATIRGFIAVAGQRQAAPAPGSALEKGPAYDKIKAGKAAASDWPTYRGNPARSGVTSAQVPAALAPGWQQAVGGRVTAPVIADGLVLVASIDENAVYALDADTGKARWTFIAGGRVDSPPTISGGRAMFGCADGFVYCLSAEDGSLAWRFRAAPTDQRIVSYERLGSVWPVHGSVLVNNDEVWFAAGRTSFMDGGLYVYRLDAATGRQLAMSRIDSRDPETGVQRADAIEGFNMAGAQNDVLSTDGAHVFMRHLVFGLDGSAMQGTYVTHLFSPLGFLDDTWWHRSYWMIGPKMRSGFRDWQEASFRVPTGQLLALGNDTAYGYGRTESSQRASHVGIEKTHYRLFAVAAEPQDRTSWSEFNAEPRFRWTNEVPVLVRAMVVAGKTLFIAGPPDLVTRDSVDGADALAGKKGGMLWAVSTADGKTLAKYTLDSPPVFDGLAAAGSSLYMTTLDGRVRRFNPTAAAGASEPKTD